MFQVACSGSQRRAEGGRATARGLNTSVSLEGDSQPPLPVSYVSCDGTSKHMKDSPGTTYKCQKMTNDRYTMCFARICPGWLRSHQLNSGAQIDLSDRLKLDASGPKKISPSEANDLEKYHFEQTTHHVGREKAFWEVLLAGATIANFFHDSGSRFCERCERNHYGRKRGTRVG